MATLFRLVIEDDEGRTTIFPLGPLAVTVGRRAGNTVRLLERNVSRRHARFRVDERVVLVEDLDSFTGVLLNGERIEDRALVEEGDVVGIGDYSLVLEARADPDEDTDATPLPADTIVDPTSASALVAKDAATDPSEELTPASTPHLDTPGLPLRVARPRLIVVRSTLAGRSFVLGDDRTLVGRGVEADLVIDHPSISRLHAAVWWKEGALVIDDLGSANGVRVDGQLLATHRLREGELLELGDVALRFVPPDATFVPTEEDVRAMEAAGVRPPPTSETEASVARTVPDPLLVQSAAKTAAADPHETTLRSAGGPPARARGPAPAAWGRSSHELEALQRQRADGPGARLWALAGIALLLVAGLGGTWFLVDAGRGVNADRDLQAAYEAGDDALVLERYERDEGRFRDPEQAAQIRAQAARRRGMSFAKRGVEAFQAGELEEAADALRRCVELASELSICHRNLAVVYTREGRFDLAADHYRRFLALDPEHPEAEDIRRILSEYEAERADDD